MFRAAVHLVYINICFDDFFGRFKGAYFKQIDDDLAMTPLTGINLVVCNDRTEFYKPLQMRSAVVHNIG